MLTGHNFASAGYKQFTPWQAYSTNAFQKCIKDEHGKKKYFINVVFWDHGALTSTMCKYSFEVRLYLPDGSNFDVHFNPSESDTVRSVEEFYENVYTKMGCIPDIHNND